MAQLIRVTVMSIYKNAGQRVTLPKTMARCAPDMKSAVQKITADVEASGGHLYLSDLFRSYDMQLQSHLDFRNGKKSAYSPPPGGSMHEAGRALDLDLDNLKMSLKDFWTVAGRHGLSPIIATPNSHLKEAWHFDCRGSHDTVYKYYAAGKGKNMKSYQAMAASGILSMGIKVDRFQSNQQAAAIQGALIRLGHEIGDIDGSIGPKSRNALTAAGVELSDLGATLAALEAQLQQKFPAEYETGTEGEFDDHVPGHVNV